MTAEPAQGRLRLSLDALDRRLLLLLDADPGLSIHDLATALDISPRSASRRFTRLHDGGVVRVLGRSAVGATRRLAHLLRIHGEPSALHHLAEALAPEPTTSWVRLSRDRTELICGTVAAAPVPNHRIFTMVLGHAGVHDVRFHELLRVWSRTSAPSDQKRNLDATDQALLAALSADGRMPVRDLARTVGIDASTASRRRRRLLQQGIVELEADIHPEALAGAGDAMLWISARPGTLQPLGQRLRSLRSVRFAAATTGPTSLVVHALVPDGSHVVEFVDEHLADDGVTGVEIITMGELFKRINPLNPSGSRPRGVGRSVGGGPRGAG